MPAMDESRKSAAPVVAAVLIILFGPLLYVLSVGPAVWLIEHEYLSDECAELVYFPIILAADYSPSFMAVLDWYLQLFQ